MSKAIPLHFYTLTVWTDDYYADKEVVGIYSSSDKAKDALLNSCYHKDCYSIEGFALDGAPV